jgi:hypothetical protein
VSEEQDKPDAGEHGNPEREGPDSPSWKPTDEPDPNKEGEAKGPPPESAPGDSGEVSTPRR